MFNPSSGIESTLTRYHHIVCLLHPMWCLHLYNRAKRDISRIISDINDHIIPSLRPLLPMFNPIETMVNNEEISERFPK